MESITLVERNRQDSMLLLQHALLAAGPRQRRVARRRVMWRWTARVGTFVLEGVALLVVGAGAGYLLTDSIHPSPLVSFKPYVATSAHPSASAPIVQPQRTSSAIAPEVQQQAVSAAPPAPSQPDLPLAEPLTSARKGL